MEKDYDKRKFFITYRQLVYIDSGEDFINEIRRQKLDASNFTIKGNDKDFKKIFDKIDKSLLKLEKSVKKRRDKRRQGLRMRIYIPQKITITVKNRLHSRQQPCRSPRQTVIGIGLRELFYQKVRLPSV